MNENFFIDGLQRVIINNPIRLNNFYWAHFQDLIENLGFSWADLVQRRFREQDVAISFDLHQSTVNVHFFRADSFGADGDIGIELAFDC